MDGHLPDIHGQASVTATPEGRESWLAGYVCYPPIQETPIAMTSTAYPNHRIKCSEFSFK